MMLVLFSPATRWMDRLAFRTKFLILGVPTVAVVVALLAGLFGLLNETAASARQELAGLQMIRPLTLLLQGMQQHRGLSSGVLNGNQSLVDRRAGKEKEVSEALSRAREAVGAKLAESAQWKEVVADWDNLRSSGMQLSAPENFQRHTRMIERLLIFMVVVADETQLTLDPEMVTYYLMDTIVIKLPSLLERLGQARALGTGILSRKQLAPAQKIMLGQLLGEIDATSRQLQSNVAKVTSRDRTLAAALEAPTREFSQGVQQVVALLQDDILVERFQTPGQEYFDVVTVAMDKGFRFELDIMVKAFETALVERMALARNQLLGYLLVCCLVLSVLGYFSIGSYFSVMNSVFCYRDGASRLAKGDLTTRFELSGNDELHQSSRQFNEMVGAIRGLIHQVQDNVRQLNDAAAQLASASTQIALSAESQAGSASSMAAAVEQMTVGVDHIAHNANEAKNISHQSDQVAGEGASVVRQLVQEIRDIAETVTAAASTVEALGKQSDQISSVASTIKEIADQTNLLALNAAIEAARAGEAGRGFAVVADEVRKLAERTTRSTQEITQTISAIQGGTAEAVERIKSGVARVEAGVDHAQHAGDTIEQVQIQSRQVVTVVDDISVSLREQAAASTEIAQSVEGIARMAEENNVAASQNRQTAGNLQNLAGALAREVAQFRT